MNILASTLAFLAIQPLSVPSSVVSADSARSQQIDDSEEADVSPEEETCIAKHGLDYWAVRACLGIKDAINIPIAELEESINTRHPYDAFILATRLFAENDRKDEGLFWFYLWQLRQRIRLSCSPDTDPSGESALFGSLFSTVGPEFNEYAGADVEKWVETINRVLAWDEANPNLFETERDCTAQRAEQRAGLQDLGKYILENRDKLPMERDENEP